ncbi:hypothetical protein Ccrd_011314 [Cynara cardunculus var. scolymus]|uniref:Uncharacterized protein n=1 Tax=Cynara cardunculus var. scolymus TaxID=59895 RepID=A0A103YJJ7_CYNCS|nr:hypothetical protein Ccrd_011314 [Cynara cardunculus var. scolymus]
MESKILIMDSTELGKNGEIKDNGKYDGEHIDGKSLDENISPPPPSPPTAATKGRGLRKWRRIPREAGKEMNSSLDSNRKRGSMSFPIGVKQKSEGSSSSTNAVSNALDRNSPLLVDFGSDFATGADSENSEDRNSRSSTAASVPRAKNLETVRILSGTNSGISVQSGDQSGKGRSVTNKKARGVRIKKENSLSSVESDSRSSNFVFAKGSNGRQSGMSGNYDEDYSDDARNGDRCLNEEGRDANEGDSEEISREDLGAENSWEVKEEKVDDPVESGDRDDLAESKLRDVGKEDPLSNDTKIFELESILNFGNMKIEHDEILKQRIAAEIEFLVISTTIQNLKTGCKDQTNLMVQQKNVAAPVSVSVPVPEAVKVEDEGETARNLRKSVRRYGFWFIIQLVLFVVALYLLVLQISSRDTKVFPT